MKRMLINATQAEELRMAMVDGQRLYDLNIEGPASERKKANIYKGTITRVEPSLEAAFVDYGAERHGFLPLKEISSEYFVKDVEPGAKPNIREVLKEGQDIVVQIDKEERGNKGAALTTFVSLAGRFIVLKPNKARSGGVSRRIVGEDRDLARESLRDVDVPDGMSVILRTAGIDRSAEELAWDLETLMKVWQAILDHVLQRPAPFLLYRESNSVIRALRDYLTNEIGEILIDDAATHAEALEFVEQVMPHNARKLKLYDDPVPLFTRFQIESQIESAFAHKVTLPSGGSIVVDHTEAMVAIDINSARATKGGDIEATALNTNLEAAEEVARQLRIRDLGGLIVIDFIDMGPQKNQREVENRLRESVRQDRARVQIGKISRFGLLEMSRQRLRPSIGESAYQTCPRCSGFGTIRSTESLALAILRIIGEEARKERTAKVIAQLPVEVATYLLNEKRDWVQGLEVSHDTQVVLVANAALETPHYDVRRVRDDQTELPENTGVSYSLAEVAPIADVPQSMEERAVAEKAAIDVINPSTPAPKPPQTGGFWAWLTGLFSGEGKEKKAKKPARGQKKAAKTGRGRGASQRGRKRAEPRQQGTKRKRSKKKKATASKAPERKRSRKKATKDQKPKAQDEAKAAAKKDEDREQQQRPTRNRRSRGGRRRRRSGADRAAADATGTKAEQKQGDKPQTRDSSQAEHRADAAPPPAAIAPARDLSRTDAPQTAAAKSVAAMPAAAAADSAAKSESRSDSRSEPKPESTPDAKTESGPVSKPVARPGPVSAASGAASQSGAPTGPRSEGPPRPVRRPASDDSAAKPDPRPAPRPETREAAAGHDPRAASAPKAPETLAGREPKPFQAATPPAAKDSAPRPAKPTAGAEPKTEPRPGAADAANAGNGAAVKADSGVTKTAMPKPEAAGKAEKTPAKPPERPAEKPTAKAAEKPQGRLLPWDSPAPAADEPPAKPAADPADQG